MLKLLLLRHAEAAASAREGDFQRPLTEKGTKDAVRLGIYFLAAGLTFDMAIVSTALRARETFEALVQPFAQKPPVIFEPELYNAPASAIRSLISTAGANITQLLLLGHNPGIAELALSLAGDTVSNPSSLQNMRCHFPAPALAIIEFDCEAWPDLTPGCGNLQFFLTSLTLQTGHGF